MSCGWHFRNAPIIRLSITLSRLSNGFCRWTTLVFPPTSPRLVVCIILGLLAAPVASSGAGASREIGVAVEEIAKGSAGERAGLKAGDMLVSWARASVSGATMARGKLDSPFDLTAVEVEQAPRGVVRLTGRRGRSGMTWTLPPGSWGLRVRPALPEELRSLYYRAKDLVATLRTEEGIEQWRTAERSTRRGDLIAWLLSDLGRSLGESQQWTRADAAYEEALAAAHKARNVSIAAQLLREWGGTFENRADLDRAEQCYRQALTLDETSEGLSLSVALDLNNLGKLATRRDDFLSAKKHYSRSLAIRRQLAPGSLEVAKSLVNLGRLAHRSGDLIQAEQYLRQSVSLTNKLATLSLESATSLSNLGDVLRDNGDLAKAEEYQRRSLAIRGKLAPGSSDYADSLGDLGLLFLDRGDLIMAEDFMRQSLAIKEKPTPETSDVATILMNLGVVAWRRGDLAAAEDYTQRSLAIAEELYPGGLDVADSLNNLGMIAMERGELPAAANYIQKALIIQERLAPGGLAVAASLDSLAGVAWKANELAKAKECHQRALAIRERLAPESLEVTYSLQGLGDVAFKEGDLSAATELYGHALAIREKLSPDSVGVAEALHSLGLTYRRRGESGLAKDLLCRAIDALDQQRQRAGGTEEARSAFSSKYAGYYRTCIDARLTANELQEAFHVHERSRARAFLALLAERDLRFSADIPSEFLSEKRRIGMEYDRAQAALGRLNSTRDAGEIERLLGQLRELREKQEQIVAAIRKGSPRFASLRYPEPLDLAGARNTLDPGTVLLAYSVGEEQTLLFVLQAEGIPAPGLAVVTLPVGAETLRKDVESFRNLLRRHNLSSVTALKAQAEGLYKTLVQPAEAQILASERILVSPDGPLHTLPFAALVHDGHYLVEEKPLHTVISTTVYAELKRSRHERPAPSQIELTAFGDPSYPPLPSGQSSTAHPEVRAAVGRGLALTPLPSTREEVLGIAALYPGARTFLGAEATEERAKSTGKDASYLHFACHGLLDERSPLNSALALTIPEHPGEGQENGLLQAWEIFEGVRLNADLVTLSACDSALGQEMGGEGLLGLTRAFQYAGARSVLASLWSVYDVSTARFMKRFYGYLHSGKSKDEALRAAQIDQIRGKSGSPHPFHWAAFELFGDWR